MFCRQLDSGGVILVTTLDPDHHSVPGTPGPSKEKTAETQRYARMLLNNILLWAEKVCQKKLIKSRHLYGVSRGLGSILGALGLYSVPGFVGYAVYRVLGDPSGTGSNQIYGIIAASAVIVSIISYGQSVWRSVRKEKS
jgi:hypothetical protein